MRINSISNVAFGYDKSLNAKLKRTLHDDASPKAAVLAQVNESCNQTEDLIRSLEGAKLEKTVANKNLINILLTYLVDAKTFLAAAVSNFYPELEYPETEACSYRIEMEQYDLPDNAFDSNGETREIFCWRDEIANNLEEGVDISTELDFKPVAKEKDMDGGDALDEMLEKFTPNKYSPKGLEDVVGLTDTKSDIEDLILYPLEHPEEAKKREEDYGIEIPNFVLLYGPPGCGKTMLAQALATQSGASMYSIDLSTLGSTYINGTLLNVTKAFDEVKEAALDSKKPIILFMDEMDSLLSKRGTSASRDIEDNKVVNSLLTLITSMQDKNVIIIGATNMYDMIDPAAIRRADLELYVGLGSKDDNAKLLKNHLSKMKMGQKLADDDEAIDETAQKLVGYSPSNIVKMIKAASKQAYREKREIKKEDFDTVLKVENFEKTNEQEYLPKNKRRKTTIGFGK